MSSRSNEQRYVYFAEACGKVKIGCSFKPNDRIWQVAEWVPYPITLLATMHGNFHLEAAIHRMFRADWSHGEWFNASPALMAFVADVAAGKPVAIDFGEIDTERMAMIVEKRLMTRCWGEAWKALPPPDGLYDEMRSQQWKGKPFPDELRARIIAYLTDAGCWKHAHRPQVAA